MLAEAHPYIAHACTVGTRSSTSTFSTPHIYEELTAAESVAGDDPEQNVTEDCALWGALCIFLFNILNIP